MWLVEPPNPNKMEQCWECIFLKVYTQVITKIASKFFFTFPPLRKPRLSKMASIKTNKIKKRTPLHNINFWKLTTLLFCPKRFRHSKGPKNAICLWLSHDNEHCWLNVQCFLSWLSQREIACLGPLEWRNLFGQKSKVVNYEKLV